MGTSECPSPYSLEIFYDSEVQRALADNPDIALHNFLFGWDEKNDCQKEYMDRPEPVEYWYCIECHRVYEVQAIPRGRWLRVFKKTTGVASGDYSKWKQIYVMPEVETDAATEKDYEIRLSDYLRQHDSVLYYLSPDETVACAIDKASSKVLFSYVLEDSWYPSAEG